MKNFDSVYSKLLLILYIINLIQCDEEIPKPPPKNFGALQKCGEGNHKNKKCVPYYNCDPLINTIIDYPEVDGSDKIHPRIAEPKCEHYLEVCCQVVNATNQTLEHAPTINLEFQSECGIRSKGWMVALFNLKSKRPICGGSLISAVVVLTAAHCVQE